MCKANILRAYYEFLHYLHYDHLPPTVHSRARPHSKTHTYTTLQICIKCELLWTSPNEPRRVHRGLVAHYQERCTLAPRALSFPGAPAVEGVVWEGQKWPPGGGRRDRRGLFRAQAPGVAGGGGSAPELVEELEELTLSASDSSASPP